MRQTLTLFIFAILALSAFDFRLPWNKGAALSLGDAGSTTLGFTVAWLLIEATQGEDAMMSPVYAPWFLAVPLIDTVNLLAKTPNARRARFLRALITLTTGDAEPAIATNRSLSAVYSAAIAFDSIGMTAYLLEATTKRAYTKKRLNMVKRFNLVNLFKYV